MILETDFVARADPARGRFRTYLLTALKRFLSGDYKIKQRRPASLPAETLFICRIGDQSLTPDDSVAPEQEFDRQWALSLLNRVLERLKALCESKGEVLTFKVFSHRLLEGELPGYGATKTLSIQLGVDPHEVDNAYQKSLRWFRDIFRQEVRAYVSSDAEVDGEIRELWRMLG
jgi:RNA polymerase sigma-70 factor (ECF subfamily)